MDEHSKDRWRVWTPLFFSLVMVAGMALGFNLRDSLRNKRDIGTVILRNDRLEEIIDLVNERYVDTVNNNTLYKDAVAGILKSLDPHTIYIPADDLEGVNNDLGGGFSGIGVEFSIMRDTIAVTGVIENGPAAGAGVHTGDQIIKVGDSVVAGVNITTGRIERLLKGKQSSKVFVTLMSASGSLKQVSITRGLIPLYSIDAGFMLDSVTGFIKINRFSATTFSEFSRALLKLKGQGAKQLVLDLRDNPGGYLDAATSIADAFLDDDKLVVYTQGVHSPKTEYHAADKGVFESGRLVVLVDEGSASASEILSGAIQDWDRGVIAGRRTFGKGLVQEQYDLPDGAALRLTVARYYTPSGRCIQRSFAKGKEAYLEDYEKRFEADELLGKDTGAIADTTHFYTANHRVVYGGGGITPDVYVPYDTARYSAALASITFGDDLGAAIWGYFVRNRAALGFKDVADFAQAFHAEEDIKRSYLAGLAAGKRGAAEKELQRPGNDHYFKVQVKAQLARILFHDNGYYAISAREDNAVIRALSIMNSAQYLKIISGK
jgi:carboxyl-terminal processing protease